MKSLHKAWGTFVSLGMVICVSGVLNQAHATLTPITKTKYLADFKAAVTLVKAVANRSTRPEYEYAYQHVVKLYQAGRVYVARPSTYLGMTVDESNMTGWDQAWRPDLRLKEISFPSELNFDPTKPCVLLQKKTPCSAKVLQVGRNNRITRQFDLASTLVHEAMHARDGLIRSANFLPWAWKSESHATKVQGDFLMALSRLLKISMAPDDEIQIAIDLADHAYNLSRRGGE